MLYIISKKKFREPSFIVGLNYVQTLKLALKEGIIIETGSSSPITMIARLQVTVIQHGIQA
jgi:hypothetical protein